MTLVRDDPIPHPATGRPGPSCSLLSMGVIAEADSASETVNPAFDRIATRAQRPSALVTPDRPQVDSAVDLRVSWPSS